MLQLGHAGVASQALGQVMQLFWPSGVKQNMARVDNLRGFATKRPAIK
jgi:hypothetical protein